MTKFTLKLTMLVAVLCTTALLSSFVLEEEKPLLQNKITYVDTNYAVEFPADWTLDTSGVMGSEWVVLSPLTSDQDSFRENINLIVEDLTGYDVSLDYYVVSAKGQLLKAIDAIDVETDERITVNGNEFHKLVYTGTISGMPLKLEQWYGVHNEMAYILSFTCTQDSYEEYQQQGETILNSFKLQQSILEDK